MYINQITQNEQQLAQQISQQSTSIPNSIYIRREPVPSNDDVQAMAESERLVVAAKIIARNPAIENVHFSHVGRYPSQAIDALGTVFKDLSDKNIFVDVNSLNARVSAFYDKLAESEVQSCAVKVTHENLRKICETLPRMKHLRRLKLEFVNLTQATSGVILDALRNCRSLELLRQRSFGGVRRATMNSLIEQIQPTLLANRHRNERVQSFEALFASNKPNKLDDRKGHRFLTAFADTIESVGKISRQKNSTSVSEVVGSKLASYLTTDDAINVAKTSKKAFNSATEGDTYTFQQINRLRDMYRTRGSG